MNSILKLFLCLGVGWVLLTGCEDNTQPLEDLTLLSGMYTGNLNVYQTGDCSINDGSHAQVETVLQFHVDSSGTITIDDFLDPDAVWTGTVEDQLDFTMLKVYSQNCQLATHDDSAYYRGDFKERTNGFSLTMTANEIWCPEDNCTFRMLYALSQEPEGN